MSASRDDKPRTPRQLWVAIGLSGILAGVVIYLGFLALPGLAPEHQAFWSGLIGSFVGSAVAFGGAAWLWRMERHILVQERMDDRAAVRLDERKRADVKALRDCLSVVGNLQALNFHMLKEPRFATARDKYLMGIRFGEAVTVVGDDVLRGELEFMLKLVDEDDGLNYMVGPEWIRLDVVHDWLLRLLSLGDEASPTTARPVNYDSISSGLESHDDFQQEQMEAMAEWEEERKAGGRE